LELLNLLLPVTGAVAGFAAARRIERWRIAHLESTQRSHTIQLGKIDGRLDAHDSLHAVATTRDRETRRMVKEIEERSDRRQAELIAELRGLASALQRRIDALFDTAWRATPPAGKS
jgi:hypothetical protein